MKKLIYVLAFLFSFLTFAQRVTIGGNAATVSSSGGRISDSGITLGPPDGVPPPEVPEIVLTTKLAFPGAFGAARNLTGGQSGAPTYYEVTNTNSSGSGSLPAVWQATGNRIAIIKVEGRIDLSSDMWYNSATDRSNLTVWGQFAPGRGLTVSGGRSGYGGPSQGEDYTGNIILRHVTFQHKGAGTPGSESPVMFYEVKGGTGIYIDHCSFRYGLDEALDFEDRYNTSNFTIAYCILAEGHEDHNTGGIIGNSFAIDPAGNYTWARNMYYNLSHRTPNIGGSTMNIQHYNNYIVNWQQRLSMTRGSFVLDQYENVFEKGNKAFGSVTPINKFDWENSWNPSIWSNNNFVSEWDETPSADQRNIWVYRFTEGGTDGSTPVVQDDQIDDSNFSVTKQLSYTEPADGVWSWDEVKAKVTASVGHNRGINADGSPGFFRDEKDASYVTKALAGTTESSYRTFASFDNSGFTGTSMYEDDDEDFIPKYFDNAGFDQPTGGETGLSDARAADRDEVIVNWDFVDYTVVNTAGYTNLEMCAAYYAGDFETILDGTNDLNLTLE